MAVSLCLIETSSQINVHFIMPVYLKTQPVDGRPGMPFVKVLRQGLICRPLFKSEPGLRLFSIGFTKDPVANRSLHKA